MLRRMAVVCAVVIVAGCGKSSKSQGSGSAAVQTVLKGCDPEKPLTEDRAKAWFRSTGHNKAEGITIDDKDLDFGEEGQRIYELGAHPCCDIPHLTIAYFYRCKVYSDAHLALHDLVLDRGWATADPAKRVEIAKSVDSLLGDSLAAPPKTWSSYKPFTPETVEAQPDGSVKLRHWVHDANCGGQGCDPMFVLIETTLGVDAFTSSRKIEEYREHPNGYGDPAVLAACDPTKPPTKDYAHAVFLDANITNFPWDSHELVDLGHDMWMLRPPGHSVSQYLWRCKHASDVSALVADVMKAEGWDTADGAKRVQIATMIDGWSHHVLDKQPAKWDAKHPFAPPTATALPEGGVKLTRWYMNYFDDQSAAPTYHHEELTYTPLGQAGLVTSLDEFSPQP